MSTDAAAREAAKGDPVTLGGGVAGQQQCFLYFRSRSGAPIPRTPLCSRSSHIVTQDHILVVAKEKPCASRSTKEGLHENILDHEEDR